MNIFLYIAGGVVLLIVILAVIAPKSYEVNRSVAINKTVPEVFMYLKYLNNRDHWSPW